MAGATKSGLVPWPPFGFRVADLKTLEVEDEQAALPAVPTCAADLAENDPRRSSRTNSLDPVHRSLDLEGLASRRGR